MVVEPTASRLRVALAFGSPMMRHGCASILTGHAGCVVVRAGPYSALDDLRADEVDVAVIGMVMYADAGGKMVRELTDRGIRTLAVLPPGVSGEAGAAVGAAGWINGATATEAELIAAVHATADPSTPSVPNFLSVRERAVLAEVARGCTDREIGDRLGISARTVQSHLDRIREKTGRRRRAELTQLAFEIGVAAPPPDGSV